MFKGLKEIYASRHIMHEIVKRNIKNQYRNSMLGVLWTILNPLLYMIVISLVFSTIFNPNNAISSYPVYLLTGIIIFDFMKNSTASALTSIIDNSGLITKVKIKHFVFPISNMLSTFVTFFFTYIALIAVILVLGQPFYVTLLMVFILLPALILFITGISLFLSAMYVFFRDIKHIYTVILTLWTYLTPLFYQVDLLPKNVQTLMQFNPMFHYVSYFRDIMMKGVVPSWQSHLFVYGLGILSLLIGWLTFRWKKNKFILYV